MKRIPSSVVVIAAALAFAALSAGGPRLYADDHEHSDRQELQALKAQVEALQAMVTTLQQQVGDLQANNATLQNQLAAVQANNALQLGPYVSVDLALENGVRAPNIVFSGANIHIVSGSGATDNSGDPTFAGLGNLIIGYDETPSAIPFDRSGSHNLVIGRYHQFTGNAFGGLVAGEKNTINDTAASVSGGFQNAADGQWASVSGGANNTASGSSASVSGGIQNTASGPSASVSGGGINTASGGWASISGGQYNSAGGISASVLGGQGNTANGTYSTVSGGGSNTANGTYYGSISGGFRNTVSGLFAASVSGGSGNTAGSDYAVVLGGVNVTDNNPNSIAPGAPLNFP